MNNLKSRKGGASLRNLKRLLCLLLVLTMLPINAFASDIIVPGSGGTSPGSGGGGSGTKWSSPTNLGPGMLLHVQQGGEQGRSRSMQFPAAGYLHFGDWSPWELRHSHALRGIGQGTRDQSTTRGTRAQKPSARSREGIKRQGADFLSRSPVQSVKEPRQRRGSSGIIKKRGIEYGELEKGFPKRHCYGGCGCISPPGPSAPKSRKSHGL